MEEEKAIKWNELDKAKCEVLGVSNYVKSKDSTTCILELESEDYGPVNKWHSSYKTR